MFTNIPGYNWKEPVATEPDLPTVGNSVGDVRVVISPLATFQWDGSTWNTFGGGGPGAVAWGDITGTLSDQLDLQSALNAKAPTASPAFSGTITTPLTASRALVTGASSELAASVVTATELALLSGKTSIGTIGGTLGATDNRIPRSDGAGGLTLQSSGITIDDSNNIYCVGRVNFTSTDSNANSIRYGAFGAPYGTGLALVSDSTVSNLLLTGSANWFYRDVPMIVGSEVNGTFTIQGYDSAVGGVRSILMRGSNPAGGNTNGGDVTIQGGNASGTGTGGNAILTGGTSASGTAGQARLRTNSTTRLTVLAGGDVEINTGELSVETAGKGLSIKEGSNARMGQATLVAGSVTVSTTAVTASSRIFLSDALAGGTRGTLAIGTITAGTSFTIESSSNTDTSTVNWIIFEPA